VDYALKILFLIMLPLGLTAPFGTTILGMVAISDIRHSDGRLYGLPLAVAGALLFPLLLLDALLVWIGLVLIAACARTFWFNAGPPETLLLTMPLVIAVDVLIVWALWRKVSGPVAGSK
jgi:hypothetical protein